MQAAAARAIRPRGMDAEVPATALRRMRQDLPAQAQSAGPAATAVLLTVLRKQGEQPCLLERPAEIQRRWPGRSTTTQAHASSGHMGPHHRSADPGA